MFSAADDALMPQMFAEELLLARYGRGPPSEKAPSSDGINGARVRADFSTPANGSSAFATESRATASMQHGEEAENSEQEQLERLTRLEGLASKWAVLGGQHGTFFGDQPKPAEKYRSHLEGLGLVAPQKLHVEAIREARLIARAKRATAPAP